MPCPLYRAQIEDVIVQSLNSNNMRLQGTSYKNGIHKYFHRLSIDLRNAEFILVMSTDTTVFITNFTPIELVGYCWFSYGSIINTILLSIINNLSPHIGVKSVSQFWCASRLIQVQIQWSKNFEAWKDIQLWLWRNYLPFQSQSQFDERKVVSISSQIRVQAIHLHGRPYDKLNKLTADSYNQYISNKIQVIYRNIKIISYSSNWGTWIFKCSLISNMFTSTTTINKVTNSHSIA